MCVGCPSCGAHRCDEHQRASHGHVRDGVVSRSRWHRAKIWDHSAGTAVVAREMAVSLGCAALSSKVFLAGLLHDIGKLLIIQSGDRGTPSWLRARWCRPASISRS